MTHITRIDLNLLGVAATLYRTRNVSQAAKELGLSQSAVSHALSRLRDQFGDPLFVRSARGVVPTDFARGIETRVQELVEKAENLFSRREAFEPSRAVGRITLATTDYFEAVAMPRLVPLLEKEAPGIQLSLRPTLGDLPRRELESGAFDLAVAGFYARLPEGFYQSKLFEDEFHCAARAGHPRVGKSGGRLTESEYFDARHALITLQGDFREKPLGPDGSGRGKRARVLSYGSYSFTGLGWVIEESDLLLTAPSLLLKRYRGSFRVRTWPCPVDLGRIQVRMVWHARAHSDPLHSWFRARLRSVCEGLHLSHPAKS